MNLPVYLDADMMFSVEEIAQKRKTAVSSIVNQILRSDKQLPEVMN